MRNHPHPSSSPRPPRPQQPPDALAATIMLVGVSVTGILIFTFIHAIVTG